MNIIIYRRRFTRWGVDGTLVIKGVKVCNTVEHPKHLLPPGEYKIAFTPIAMKKKKGDKTDAKHVRIMPVILKKSERVRDVTSQHPYLMPGNGPLALKKGCIILGKAVASGLVIHSMEYFDRLYERVRKVSQKKESIELRIINLGSDEIPMEY